MALTKFTDAAGREAWKDDKGMVFTVGGSNPTYYNVADWNTRQAKKYNTSASSLSSDGGSGVNDTSYNSIFKNVTDQFAPSFNESVKGLSDTAKSVKSGAEDVAQSYKDQIPTVQNIYTQLAAELAKTFETETATKTQEKSEGLAAQAQEAAAGGFDTSTGFEAAQKRITETKYDTVIASVADSYRINADKLAAEETKDIQSLLSEAAQALQSGNETVANINLNIAKLKQDQQTLITQASTAIMSANNAAEQNKIQSEYNTASLKLKQEELDLTAQKLAQDARTSDQKQVVIGDDGKIHIVNLTQNSETPLDITKTSKSETQLKEEAKASLRDDIMGNNPGGKSITDIQTLSSLYPEFNQAEINAEITALKQPSFFQGLSKFFTGK